MLSIEDMPPEQAVYVSNDLLEPWQGSLRWSLEDLTGAILSSGQAPVSVAPQSARQACRLDFSDLVSDENMRKLVFIAELWQGDQLVSRQTAGFAPTKHISLVDPAIQANLRMENDQLNIELISQSLALLVEVSLVGADVVFSDNYFNLPAGRTARISCTLPPGWSLQQAQNAIQIKSIYDSY
jgi:beta-mannosidase